MKDLRLSEIWIYPVKSLGGVRVSSAKVMEKGLAFDRRFLLVDEGGMFLTQRVHPTMALFKTSVENGDLHVRHLGDEIVIPLTPSTLLEAKPVQIWDDLVLANEVNEAISTWFSEHLKMKCRLVFFPEENLRAVDPRYQVNNEHVSFADAYPLLIIGQSSLDDLNSKLAKSVQMDRFRPNLVFTGGEPFEEDQWRNFTAGNNRFVGVKPCARCVMTTVDQDTAKKSAEPLKTLASYRTKNNKVLFGQNVVAVDHFEVNEGDIITLQ